MLQIAPMEKVHTAQTPKNSILNLFYFSIQKIDILLGPQETNILFS